MILDNIKPNELKSEELAKLVSNVQEIAGEGYEVTSKNYEIFMKPLKKILRLSKQEQEWYLYFYAMYYIFYLSIEHSKYDVIVKYAELYYKESALYMDNAIPNYPRYNMAALNVWIYSYIFRAYYHYHQIDDAKMDAFMAKYEESALKYGKTYKYYEDLMKLSNLYRDAGLSKEAARGFWRYEKDMYSCYVCGHKPYLSHLVLMNEKRQAEKLMNDLINKNVPRQHLWCYDYCLAAAPQALYKYVVHMCIVCGNEELFGYFYTKYWKKLPYETQWEPDGDALRRLLCALPGIFSKLKDDIREAEKNIREQKHYATVDYIEIALTWWCYFTLLDRSGVHEIKMKLPGIGTSDVGAEEEVQDADREKSQKGAKGMKGAGRVPTSAAAEYMEKRADELGTLFMEARARFDYEGLKSTYRNCFLLEQR